MAVLGIVSCLLLILGSLANGKEVAKTSIVIPVTGEAQKTENVTNLNGTDFQDQKITFAVDQVNMTAGAVNGTVNGTTVPLTRKERVTAEWKRMGERLAVSVGVMTILWTVIIGAAIYSNFRIRGINRRVYEPNSPGPSRSPSPTKEPRVSEPLPVYEPTVEPTDKSPEEETEGTPRLAPDEMYSQPQESESRESEEAEPTEALTSPPAVMDSPDYSSPSSRGKSEESPGPAPVTSTESTTPTSPSPPQPMVSVEKTEVPAPAAAPKLMVSDPKTEVPAPFAVPKLMVFGPKTEVPAPAAAPKLMVFGPKTEVPAPAPKPMVSDPKTEVPVPPESPKPDDKPKPEPESSPERTPKIL